MTVLHKCTVQAGPTLVARGTALTVDRQTVQAVSLASIQIHKRSLRVSLLRMYGTLLLPHYPVVSAAFLTCALPLSVRVSA